MIIEIRRSQKGTPHFVANYKGYNFSICYFNSGQLFRIFEWHPKGGGQNKKLIDVRLEKGSHFELGPILDGLIEKFEKTNYI